MGQGVGVRRHTSSAGWVAQGQVGGTGTSYYMYSGVEGRVFRDAGYGVRSTRYEVQATGYRRPGTKARVRVIGYVL